MSAEDLSDCRDASDDRDVLMEERESPSGSPKLQYWEEMKQNHAKEISPEESIDQMKEKIKSISGQNSPFEKRKIHENGKLQLSKYSTNSSQKKEDLSNQMLIQTKAFSAKECLEDLAPNQKEQIGLGQRAKRTCREKTTNYSLTHKGIIANNQSKESGHHPLTSRRLSTRPSGMFSCHSEQPIESNKFDSKEEQIINKESFARPHKKSVPKTAEQCLQIIRNMFAFDWTLKDIANLRHSPQSEMTHSIYWFYINSLYFPFKALQIAQQPVEEFVDPILQNLKPINKNIINNQEEEIKQSNNQQDNEIEAKAANETGSQEKESSQSQGNGSKQNKSQDPDFDLPNYVSTLFRDKRFRKFKKILKLFQDKAVQETFREPPKQAANHDGQVQEDAQMNEIEELQNEVSTKDDDKEQLSQKKFKIMIDLVTKEIEGLEVENREQINRQYEKLRGSYEKALTADESELKDETVYTPLKMHQYGIDFISKVDPRFIQDINNNLDWYLENYNEILLNVSYPSRQEKEFLKHVEQVQQRKNDIKYKKILKQIEQAKRGNQQIIIEEEEKYQNMSMHKRALVNQEDAQCVICNSGDYEDEDLIVFCGNCNMPVHQSCYGIEQLPEGDWLCYNCDIFGFKRGLMVCCLLCPKKGGAMKPTNIFTSVEFYQKYNSNNSSSKKSAKKHHHSYNKSASEPCVLGEENERKVILGENEDKNLSLNVILSREFEVQSQIKISLKKQSDEGISVQNDIELNFDQQEKETQLPDDYSYFIQRNEPRLESQYNSSSQTLYEWIHLSCATWIPGPLVTPKTPVRLNKFDEKRFNLQCIICFKKVGACMQCQAPRCNIAFHIECARRANYCMEIEKKDRDKSFKMFCEKHRPLKIVKEMEERDQQTVDEIQKFCKIIDKCMDIDMKHQLKPSKHEGSDKRELSNKKLEKQLGISSKPSKQRERRKECDRRHYDKVKKWREKDKKQLFERVKEKYLLFRKMRIYVTRVDPFKRSRVPTHSRKRSKKRLLKQDKQPHIGGRREGLRSKQSSTIMSNHDESINGGDQDQKMELEQEKPFAGEGQLQDNEEEKCEEFEIAQEEEVAPEGIHYKFSSPIYPAEMDWTITLSRNDFPWQEIRFSHFSAKDCYEKYQSIVRDPQTFLKKVLGLKEKYKKMMHNQLQLSTSTNLIIPIANGTYDNSVYCFCKGKNLSELMVKCDGDQECTNGSWIHPECTQDLKDMPKDDLDNLQEWYCQDCVARIKIEDEDDGKQEEDEEDQNEDIEEDYSENNERIEKRQEEEEQDGELKAEINEERDLNNEDSGSSDSSSRKSSSDDSSSNN